MFNKKHTSNCQSQDVVLRSNYICLTKYYPVSVSGRELNIICVPCWPGAGRLWTSAVILSWAAEGAGDARADNLGSSRELVSADRKYAGPGSEGDNPSLWFDQTNNLCKWFVLKMYSPICSHDHWIPDMFWLSSAYLQFKLIFLCMCVY